MPNRNLFRPVPPEHVERIDRRMRDASELENLTPDVRKQGKREVEMPWSTGRALRSTGHTVSAEGANPSLGLHEGHPVTPLAELDLHARVSPSEREALDRELSRAQLHDRISEGVLDIAEAQGVPLIVEETIEEAEAREQQEREPQKD